MQWHGFRVSVVILALLAGLAIFLGGQWLNNRYNLEQPLEQTIRGSAAVESFKVFTDEPILRIEVKFKNVENLRQSYLDLLKALEPVLGNRDYKLEVQDKRDSVLEDFGQRSGFALYEAVERGNYGEMESNILSLAGDMKVSARVYIDQDYIYVQAKHGENYYYQIVPRRAATAGNLQGEGGVTR